MRKPVIYSAGLGLFVGSFLCILVLGFDGKITALKGGLPFWGMFVVMAIGASLLALAGCYPEKNSSLNASNQIRERR
jgi:hypothetical protein